jgi:predicted amidohydrolase YtcJ
MLSEDVLAIAPERIRDVMVDLTILGGQVIHERAAAG